MGLVARVRSPHSAFVLVSPSPPPPYLLGLGLGLGVEYAVIYRYLACTPPVLWIPFVADNLDVCHDMISNLLLVTSTIRLCFTMVVNPFTESVD